MKKRRLLIILVVFLFGCAYTYAQNRSFSFDHLSVKDGLSQISVLSIHEDSEGYMWFGTRKGLNRYDGYKFTYFQELSGAISNNNVTCITEDDDHSLWAGTRRGLNRYDRTENRFVQYLNILEDSLSLSNNSINCLLKDSKGCLWVGTSMGLNLYVKETDVFVRIVPGGPEKGIIYNLAEDKNGNLWIGTANGLFVYNLNSHHLRAYYNEPGNPYSLSANRTSAIYCDSKGVVWVGAYQAGVCRYDAEKDNFIRYTEKNGLNSSTIRCFEEDKEGKLLIGTFDGLNVYNLQTNRFENVYGSSLSQEVPVSNFSIYALHCDRAGTVWIGTYSGGVSSYNQAGQRFRLYDPGMQGRKMYGIVGPMIDRPEGLWIGTEGGGLLFYDRSKNDYTYYLLPGATSRSNSRNIVKSLLYVDGRLFVGTTQSLIYCFDIEKREFTETIQVPWGNNYYALLQDNERKLWIGATGSGALGYLKPDKQFVSPIPLDRGEVFNPSNVRSILMDSVGVFFIATAGQGLYLFDEKNRALQQWRYDPDDSTSLCMNEIYSLVKTKDNVIWVGTPGGGIGRLDRETGTFRNYNKSHGLESNTIYTLLEDQNGNIWMSTAAGISMFDPVREVFTNYNRNNGVGISEFTPGSGVVTTENEVFFGGNDGFISFHPEDIKTNTYVPPVVITGLSINNQPVDYIEKHISEPLRLSYKQSNFTLEFSALNYIFPNQNQYAYKLEGFDHDWNYVGHRREAYYTNIQPGHYTFHVKGSNNDGIWNNEGVSLQIRILPPPWATWWAWTLYILTALIITALIIRYARIKTRLENNIRIKQMEQENLEILHQTKIKLFTSFAHELRTPLTLIMSPLEDILQRNGLEAGLQDTLKLMQRNANRLLVTVNQLMDFRKKESGHLQIKAAQGNIVKFTNEIVLAFNELARSRMIDFSFNSSVEEQQLWYDRNLLEKVIFNLLSNAFKNTPDGGNIRVILRVDALEDLQQLYPTHVKNLPENDYVLLEVKDTGSGIPLSEMEKIFEPFYQVYRKETSHLFGTGLGLNLSKGVIELHQGAIWTDNRPEGGAVFRIVLPFGNAHLKENELEPEYKNSEDTSFYVVSGTTEVASETATRTEDGNFAYTVLVVEDNPDVRHYIKSHVGKYYQVLEAGDGNTAFDMAVEHLPDLIISDIMMPGKDGIELCHQLKEDLRTGHIPVILLTARVTVLQIQEGFETGADEYITKPFNAGLLLTRVKNLIATRVRLKELFGKDNSPLFPELPTSSVDKRFMDSIYAYIIEHLSEPELNMDDFYKEIGMSRSGFYRKLKSLSDLSPVELIRNTRMQFAAKYIKESDLSVSEIAYKVGFSSPSYFTKTFKSFFNQSPTEMREEKE